MCYSSECSVRRFDRFPVGSRQRRSGAPTLRWLALFVLWLGGNPLWAHDAGISTAQGVLRADALVLTTGFAPADVEQLLPPAARPGERWTETEFSALHDRLLEMAPRLWEARVGTKALIPVEVRVELEANDNVSFTLVYPYTRENSGTPLTLRAPRVPELPSNHRQFVIIADERGSTIVKKLLSSRDFTLEVPLSDGGVASSGKAQDEAPPTWWGFIALGVTHIWTGYDHLLFLLALLIVCRSFRSIVAIISCFTLAHSMTLAVATLGWINLPTRFVEPAIAASIVFVGAENLWRRGEEPRGRALLTFVFGLIHGFGFASVLSDLGVGRGSEGIAGPLFTFNLGVEVGQIAIAALVLPIVWQLRKNPWFLRRGVPALSAVIVAAGLYWFLQRTVFA